MPNRMPFVRYGAVCQLDIRILYSRRFDDVSTYCSPPMSRNSLFLRYIVGISGSKSDKYRLYT